MVTIEFTEEELINLQKCIAAGIKVLKGKMRNDMSRVESDKIDFEEKAKSTKRIKDRNGIMAELCELDNKIYENLKSFMPY